MKHFYLTLTFLLTAFVAIAQIPANYYDSANGLSSYTLKTELRDIITSGHTPRSYGQLYDGVGISGSQGYIDTHSDVSVTSGQNYENDGTLLDMYSENPAGNDPYNYNHGVAQCGNQSAEGDCYNREHLVPSSSWGGSSSATMYTDIHHVVPSDGRVNGFRGTLPFGDVATPNWTSLNGSKRGSSGVTGYSGTMFEPLDEFKGDIARAILYFATRYQNNVDTYSFDMFNGTEDQVFENWALATLLDWHNNVDPVDQRERDRNNAAYNFQGNANPFVDHPEYADLIWNPNPDTQAPTTPTNLVASNPTSNTIDLSWMASTDNTGVTSYDVYVDGGFYVNTSSSNITYTVTGLTPETTYSFTVLAKDAGNNMSGLSASASETTIAGSSGSNDLFFSEYIEGSSNNKVLEINNTTGATVDLSIYTIKKSVNGSANWDSTVYSFPANAQITNANVYVSANSSTTICISQIDDLTGSSVFQFNGNDPVGLFKNNVLIDIVGTLGGGSANFAKDKTLVRNTSITGGNTSFDINEWTESATNDCSNLGSHTQTLNTVEFKTTTFKVYPNPVKGNLLNIEVKQNTRFEIYSILGKKILEGNVTPTNKQVSVSRLNKGVYILKLETPNGSISKKLVKD